MDSAQALHQFWSSFGWKAYDATTVPSQHFDPEMPRITYEVAMSEFLSEVALTASLWDRSYSWEHITRKAEVIYNYIGLVGKIIEYDDGYLWIKRGSPFSMRLEDEDDAVRRIRINIDVEYFTAK